MLDIKLIRDSADWVRQRLASRHGGDEAKVGEVLSHDTRRRELITQVESLKAQKNKVSKEIGALMAQGKSEEADAKKEETRSIGDQISELDRQAQAAEQARNDLLMQLPNVPQETVPEGETEQENVLVRSWGNPPSFDFHPQAHIELCEALGLVDFARARKLAGSGFLLYRGWGARLERALGQFMVDLHTEEHGYSEISPPVLVNRDVMTGVGQFPKFSDQVYAVQEGEDPETLGRLFLIPTAEAPVANLHRDEILKAGDLPLNYCAQTPCFRAEAGAAGVGTRGMIRVHQFDKVELIKVVEPEQSAQALETMVREAETVLQRLGLTYRVLELCTGDIGFASAKTYDIEVWAPGQGQFLEVSSCSNCESFQARRMNLRYKSQGNSNRYPHVLNGSGTALARLYVALLETYQQSDGSVTIPEALASYLKADCLTPPS